MKKLLVLLTLSIAGSPFFAYSQGVSIGAKTGMNLSNAYAEDDWDSDNIPGFIFGGYVNYPISSNFFYSPEIMYSGQGYKIYWHDGGVGTSTRVGSGIVHLHYLNLLPLSAKWYFAGTKLINVLIGAQLGWLMKARLDGESDSYTATKEFPRFDISAVLGLGSDLKSGVNFGCRVNLGLTDLRGWGGDNAYLRNIVFQAHIGYTFIKR